MKSLMLAFLFAALSLSAKDLGKAGVTFPIEEESLIDGMKSKAALHQPQLNDYAAEIQESIQNPPPIQDIGKALERRSKEYDPTYTIEEDIEVDGKIVYKKGTKINLLETGDLPGGLLFFDGSDPAQVAWAKRAPLDFKWILVKGSPIALEEKEERPVYFDQFGFLTTRFQIQNVPAKVAQSGAILLIEEIPVDEKGEEKP